MATANDLISGALSLLGVIGVGESVNGDEAEGCLSLLNNMVDSWNTERLFIYTVQNSTATLSGATLTIGPGATVNVTRPVIIEDNCFATFNNVDYPIKQINKAQYDSIALKSQTSTYPYNMAYDGNFPTGTLYFWPVPVTPVTVTIRLWTQLSEFADLGTDYDLPQGYRRALMYSLAEELSPQYRALSPQISKIAAKARANIKRVNAPNDVLDMPARMMGRRMGFNIYTGQ